MAITLDGRLYRLYRDFGSFQLRRNRPHDAADVYALALYYARRLGDEDGVRECRKLIAERNPDHIAVQTASSPLYFAQLMMKFPADEVEEALQFANAPALTSYSTRTATAPSNVESKPPYPNFSDAPHPPAELEAHHPLPARPAPSSARPFAAPLPPETTPIPPIAVRSDDFLLEAAGMLEGQEDDRDKGYRTANDLIEWFARGAILFGVVMVAYLSRELYPLLTEIRPQEWWTTATSLEPDGAFVAVDEESKPPSAAPSLEPTKALPNVGATEPPPTLSVGANTPTTLDDEPDPPAPVKLAKKTPDGSSQ